MPRRYVVLLRAISNVGMQSFRRQMEALGLSDVESFGMSGNLLFQAASTDPAQLERRIAKQFGTAAFVRTPAQLKRVVMQDPFHSAVLFLAQAPTAARRRAFLQLEFGGPRPLLRGKTLFYEHPARLRGKKAIFDFERALGVEGTARSAGVVGQIVKRLSKPASKSVKR